MGKFVSYETKIKQRRGYGDGQDYVPWIKVGEKASQNYSGSKSRGNGHKILGLKTKRIHHLLSNYEKLIFIILDLNPEIKDIKEQFPLNDIARSKRIAKELGIKYPSPAPNHLLTSDFKIEYKSGKVEVITFKPLSNINDRQNELFQVEKTYWEQEKVSWRLMTDRDIPRNHIMLKNFADIHYSISSFINNDFSVEDIQRFYSHLYSNGLISKNTGVVDFCNQADEYLGFESGLGLRIFKVLIGRRIIHAEIKENIFSNEIMLNDIKISANVKSVDKSSLVA